MKKILVLFGSLLISTSFLISCKDSAATTEISDSSTNETINSTSSGNTTENSSLKETDKITFYIPNDWQEDNGIPDMPVYFSPVSANENFKANLIVTESPSGGLSPETYCEESLKVIKGTLSSTNESSGTIESDKYTILYNEYSATMYDMNLCFYQPIVFIDDSVYIFTFTGTADDISSYKETINDIVKSVELK